MGPLAGIKVVELAGIGPGAYAERADTVDLTVEDHVKIVPLRLAPTFAPMADGPDPRD